MSIIERKTKSTSFYCGDDSVRWIGRKSSCSLLLLFIDMKYAEGEIVRPNRVSSDTCIVTGIINSVGRLRMVLLDIVPSIINMNTFADIATAVTFGSRKRNLLRRRFDGLLTMLMTDDKGLAGLTLWSSMMRRQLITKSFRTT